MSARAALRRFLGALCLGVALGGAAAGLAGCEQVFIRGEGGSSSEPDVDIGVRF